MGRLFGTDGARGIAITELTCELAMQIGRASALELTKTTNHKPTIYIGKDTRISSDILENALISGICSVGANAVRLGVVPTPAVAYLIKKNNADAGVMISASHNSVEYNGIKLFASTGYKLPDDVENEIERLILDNPEEIKLVSHTNVGRVLDYPTAKDDYIDYVCSTIKEDLFGINVALDCANGSSSVTAEKLFTKLGANVHVINDKFDGTNQTGENPDTSKKLKDAKFVLYRKVTTDGKEKVEYYYWNETDKKVDWVDNVNKASVVTTNDKGAATFNGLAAGTYYLKETKAPDGYNTQKEDAKVEIKAVYNTDGTLKADADGCKLKQDAEGKHYYQVESIANKAGAVLPSTGGIGTTIFYVLGSILVLGAAVLLIAKKRMNGQDR